MNSITDLNELIRTMQPTLREGAYVFCTVQDVSGIDAQAIIGLFKEREGITIILPKQKADELLLQYDYVAAWITLEVHSSLAAVGLTAAFATVLAKAGISCNVVAGFYHDHLFVAQQDAAAAMAALKKLAATDNAL
jgi:hypothetical protein